MDNAIFGREASPIIGIPYKNMNWEDIPGQPFGLASQFNLFVFGDANNIVDVEGAMAVGGSFYSPRSLSVGFEREKGQVPIEFSPDLVRYLVGDIVSMKGPLVVTGHAVSGGNFSANPGSTYFIGKSNFIDQPAELKHLYQADGGSPYWTPSDKGDYYIIPSYDVPRIIPASRIDADLSLFFQNARRSIETFLDCMKELDSNGTVTSNSYEWVLTGSDPRQNIFTLDTRPNGLLNKGIRFNIPQGSIAIVRLRTGPHAHLQYGLYGEERLADHILYVFEDATNIHMEQSADIWGSILAPQAMFHGHPTGGRVSGNAVLGGFAVNPNSGFEFHLYPFVGGVDCMDSMPLPAVPEIVPMPEEEILPESPVQVETPIPMPETVSCPVCPDIMPCPTCPEAISCPVVPPCPACPEVIACPACPEIMPCPACPEAIPCPVPLPCPACPEIPPCPPCPEQMPCPVCPVCPEQMPCPICPENETEYVPVPIPVPVPVKEVSVCPVCRECLITPGIIAGCILGCDCCRNHEWDVMLYRMAGDRRSLVDCITICHLGCFRFEVDYDGTYILKICPIKKNCFLLTCRPEVTFKNIGVANFTLE